MLKQASEEKNKKFSFQGINKGINDIGGNVSQNNNKTIQKRENDIQPPTNQGIFQRTEDNSTGTLDDYGLMKPEKPLNYYYSEEEKDIEPYKIGGELDDMDYTFYLNGHSLLHKAYVA